jgi:hypothetical protein
MAATTPDLFSDLNETIAHLKILVKTAELQLQLLRDGKHRKSLKR